MGMLALKSKESKVNKKIKNVGYNTLQRSGNIQIEGLFVNMKDGMQIGFIYCRTKPTHEEIKAINEFFINAHIVLGDFNLSHRDEEDKSKLQKLVEPSKVSMLEEITRLSSLNQLDYILIDKKMKDYAFVTSYHNLISDHNSIVA